MATKTRITPSVRDLLAQDRHTDWLAAQERGAHRSGRPYVVEGFLHGAQRTKKAVSKRACRGRVRDY